jgi:hypothetical protein
MRTRFLLCFLLLTVILEYTAFAEDIWNSSADGVTLTSRLPSKVDANGDCTLTVYIKNTSTDLMGLFVDSFDNGIRLSTINSSGAEHPLHAINSIRVGGHAVGCEVLCEFWISLSQSNLGSFTRNGVNL